jgi:hypothetical protein
MVAARKLEPTHPTTEEWKRAVRGELEGRPRGALTRLAEAIGASTGQVTEMLSEKSQYSSYVTKVNAYFGWPAPPPPLVSQDAQEIQYLIKAIGPDAKDLLRALMDMSKEERLAHIGLIKLGARRRES